MKRSKFTQEQIIGVLKERQTYRNGYQDRTPDMRLGSSAFPSCGRAATSARTGRLQPFKMRNSLAGPCRR